MVCRRGLVVVLEYGVDGEVGPAPLLDHDEGLDGAQRLGLARRARRGLATGAAAAAAFAAARLLSARLLLHFPHH